MNPDSREQYRLLRILLARVDSRSFGFEVRRHKLVIGVNRTSYGGWDDL